MENNIDQVDLAASLKLTIKNKNIILCFFVAGLLLAAVFIIFAPKTYTATAVVEIGQADTRTGSQIGGALFPILDPEHTTNLINSSLPQKYHSLRAVATTGGLVRISNSSAGRTEAEKGVLEAVSMILSQSADFQQRNQAEIIQLKTSRDSLKLQGQQVADIELRIFDLQNELDNITPSSVIEGPATAQKFFMNPVIVLVIGAVLGVLAGLFFVFWGEWWAKNKKNIL
jgi:hypothetical protein